MDNRDLLLVTAMQGQNGQGGIDPFMLLLLLDDEETTEETSSSSDLLLPLMLMGGFGEGDGTGMQGMLPLLLLGDSIDTETLLIIMMMSQGQDGSSAQGINPAMMLALMDDSETENA